MSATVEQPSEEELINKAIARAFRALKPKKRGACVTSVKGDTVRIKTGVAEIDLKIIELGNGKYRVRKPNGVFIQEPDFPWLVRIAIEAYKETAK